MLYHIRSLAVAMLLTGGLSASALNTYLLIHPIEGKPYAVELADGLTISMDESTLTITSLIDPIRFSLNNVARFTYGIPEISSSTSPVKDNATVCLTHKGLEISATGHHILEVFDTTGKEINNCEFTDFISIDKTSLPHTVIVIVVDQITVIKLAVK